MAYIHQDSPEGMNSDLDMFSLLMTNTNVEKTRHVKAFPTTAISSSGPIEFVIMTGPQQMVDMSDITLIVKQRIVDTNGQSIPGTVLDENEEEVANEHQHVVPLNYFHASKFKNVEIFINNKLVSSQNNLYPYRAYLEALLSYNRGFKKSHLCFGMYYKDVNFRHDNFLGIQSEESERSTHVNHGAQIRHKLGGPSQLFETAGKLHTDLTLQPRPLPPNTELRIRLHRAEPAFCLHSLTPRQGYTVAIDEAYLFYQVKTIAPGILVAHAKTLQRAPYRFPLRKVDMKFFSFSSGKQDLSVQNLCNGNIPRKVVVGLVRADAFHNTYEKNGFCFEHFSCGTMTMRVNGEPIPYDSLSMNYDHEIYAEGYYSLLSATGMLNSNRDIGVSVDDYVQGYTLYGFDLTGDHNADSSAFYLIKEGTVSLECKLLGASSHGIVMVAYIEYDSVLNIDKDGQVFFNE